MERCTDRCTHYCVSPVQILSSGSSSAYFSHSAARFWTRTSETKRLIQWDKSCVELLRRLFHRYRIKWCRACCVRVLCKVVICIPVPEIETMSRSKARGTQAENIELNERLADEHEEDTTLDDMGRRGHILWIRGLTRLQTQVYSRRTNTVLTTSIGWRRRRSVCLPAIGSGSQIGP